MNSPNSMPQGEKLYEGKAKIIYRSPSGTYLQYFKNSATAFNAQKKAEFEGKAELNCRMTTAIFEYLAAKGIPTHFIRQVDNRCIETLALKMLPLEVVVRNKMAGSLARRLQEKEGADLHPALVEWYLKDDLKADPQVSEDLLISFYKLEPADLSGAKDLALQVNSLLKPIFAKAGLILVDFKLEFGKDAQSQLKLADEFSPDNSRLWDEKTKEKFDKDRFRFDLGDLMTGYREVWSRLEKVLK